MKTAPRDLHEKLESLKKIHYQALHELADAVQIIKSYEFLQKLYEDENNHLKKICALAEDLCKTNAKGNARKKTELERAILEYKKFKNSPFQSDVDDFHNFKSFWSNNSNLINNFVKQ